MDRYSHSHFSHHQPQQTRYLPQLQPFLSHHNHRLPPPRLQPQPHPPPLQNPQSYFPSVPPLPHQLSHRPPQLPPRPLPPPPSSYQTLQVQHPRPYSPPLPQFAAAAAAAPPSSNYSKPSRNSHSYSHRLPVHEHHNHRSVPESTGSYHGYRASPSGPQRVLPDNHVARSYPPHDFNREVVKRPSEHKHVSPHQQVDSFSHDLESGSRFRVEYNNGFRSLSREEFVRKRLDDDKFHHRADFVSSRDRDRDYTSGRNFESDSGSYDRRRSVEYDDEVSRDGRREENSMWVHDRITPRDVHDIGFELEDMEIGYEGSSGDWMVTRDGVYHGSVCTDRVCRESSHEYNRTPKKKLQKKSALLRLQKPKPSNRSRESENFQMHCSGYCDDSGFNPVRGRDQREASDYQMEVEKREGSPVELDVSFKSNSLVAKAIVTSSNSVIPDANLTPATKKMRKALLSDDKSQKSQSKESAEKLDNSRSAVNRTSTRGKDTQTDRTSTGSDKASPLKVARKKKIVKKIVRKVVNPNLSRMDSQQPEKPDVELEADGSKLLLSTASSPEKLHKPSEVENANVNGVLSHPTVDRTPEKASVSDCSLQFPENNAGTISSQVLRLKNFGFGSNAGEEKGNRETAADAMDSRNSALKFSGFLNSGKVPNKSLNESSIDVICNLEGPSKQSSPEKVSLSQENNNINGKMGVIYCAVDNAKLGPCSSIDIEHDKELVKLCENDKIQGTQDTASTPHTTENIEFFSSKKTGFQDGPTHAECIINDQVTNIDSDNGCPGSWSSIPVLHSSIEDGNGQKLSSDAATQSPIHCVKERASNVVSSIECGEGDVDIVKSSNVRTPISFSSSNAEHESVKAVDIEFHTIDVDETLNSSEKDLRKVNSNYPSEGLVTSLGIIADSISSTHGRSLLDRSSEEKLSLVVNADNVSKDILPLYYKKRKFSATSDDTPVESDVHSRTVFISPHAEICHSSTIQQMEEAVVPSQVIIPPPALRQCLEDSAFLRKNMLGGGFDAEGSKLQKHNITPLSIHEELIIQKVQSTCLTVSGKECKDIHSSKCSSSYSQDITNVENALQEKAETDRYLSDKMPFHGETAECKVLQTLETLDGELKSVNVVASSCSLDTDVHCSSQPKNLPLPTYIGQVSATNSNGEPVESVPDALPSSAGTETEVPCSKISTFKASLSVTSNGKDNGYGSNLDIKLKAEDDLDFVASRSPDQYSQVNTKAGHATTSGNTFIPKIALPLSQSFAKSTVQHSSSVKSNLKNDQPCHITPASPSSLPSVKKSLPANQIGKARTWHRGASSSAGILPSKRQRIDKMGNVQNISYIRKGNSLVRKPVSFPNQSQCVDQRDSSGLTEHPKTTKPQIEVGVVNQTTPCEKPAAAMPPSDAPLVDLTLGTEACVDDGTCDHTVGAMNSLSGSLDVTLSNGCSGSSLDLLKVRETNDVPTYCLEEMKCLEAPENLTGPSKNMEGQSEVNDQDLSNLAFRRIVYVKRKANQLVATTRSCAPVSNGEVQSTTSDSYYKKRKNQLIRSTQENQLNQKVQAGEKLLKHRPPKIISSKKRSLKAATKLCLPLRASLVWTLHGTCPSQKVTKSFHHWKILPKPFAWKRAKYWRSLIHKPTCGGKSSSLSSISKKLLSLRKMDTVYTRSKNGFSLRKSKVLGIAGSSLKWSKSIEKRSKKANEEATRAVAAVDRKKREQKDATSFSFGTERERIFRIGSIRYKMDPSRRTLQRISDGGHACTSSLSSDKDVKRSYVPRRLVIGNNEYVQIGNGNQLIRDPKKRTRMLACEKVRWSLHTARMRLAKKHQYCQFFTRFGKCNKQDGKCPYIHDPSKIAVCTKFLSGLCCNPSCRLTHKVIPERMPDCSYFLQGLCTNRNCPYRHVNVNPKASICEAFLRGYCADGNECRKKHSYVCPAFQATGTCPQPESCKLYHPKSQDKGKRRKRSEGKKNARGRYFGLMGINASEPGLVFAPKQDDRNTVDNSFKEELAEFISLGGDSDIEVGESFQISEQPTSRDNSGSSLDDLDELIKPVLIMMETSLA